MQVVLVQLSRRVPQRRPLGLHVRLSADATGAREPARGGHRRPLAARHERLLGREHDLLFVLDDAQLVLLAGHEPRRQSTLARRQHQELQLVLGDHSTRHGHRQR